MGKNHLPRSYIKYSKVALHENLRRILKAVSIKMLPFASCPMPHSKRRSICPTTNVFYDTEELVALTNAEAQVHFTRHGTYYEVILFNMMDLTFNTAFGLLSQKLYMATFM